IFTALRRGGRAGLMAAALAVCVDALRPNDLGFFHYLPGDLPRLLMFAAVCLLLVAMCERVFRARRDAEAALAEESKSESRIISTLESITDAFCAIDHQWRYTYINRACEVYLGKPRGELLGRVMWEAFPALLGTDIEQVLR